MKLFIRALNRYTHDESGATALEYGLLAALVALGISVVAIAIGTELEFFGVGSLPDFEGCLSAESSLSIEWIQS